MHALSQVGLDKQALHSALPMTGRALHSPGGDLSFQSYSADGKRAINSISRSLLNESLLDCAEQAAGVKIYFSHQLTAIDPEAGAMEFSTPDGQVSATAEGIIASDGAYSATRRLLAEGSKGAGVTAGAGATGGGAGGSDFFVQQYFLQHGYKELTIPAHNGEFPMDPRSLHIWPRGSSMMIALPNTDRSFTCTLFWPKDGAAGFAALQTPEQITDYFAEHYRDALELIPDLVDDFQHNPVGSLVTVHCWPWVRGRLALLGDAAHAIVPFFGQGANCSFEDCIELDSCLEETGGDWSRTLALYQVRRKDNADAIAEMALENFVEMSDKVNSRVFQLQNKFRHFLERVLAGRYVSRYELVSFTTQPYKEINPRIRRQDRIVALAAMSILAAAGLLLRTVVRTSRNGAAK